MEFNTSSPSIYKEVLQDICSEGLEGISLELLWLYVAKRLKIKPPLPLHIKRAIWEFLIKIEGPLEFYVLPIAREGAKLYDRWSKIDPILDVPVVPPKECPYVRYKVNPIKDEINMGSCEQYETRKRLKRAELSNKDFDEVVKRWGNKLVIVGAQEMRDMWLYPKNQDEIDDLTVFQYVFIEAVARGRENGETCAGPWSLLHYNKDPSMIFYIKQRLVDFGIAHSSMINELLHGRIQLSNLVTLSHYATCHPTRDMRVLTKMVEHCKSAPEHYMNVSDARKLLPAADRKKAFNKILTTDVFNEIFELTTVSRPKVKKASETMQITVLKLRNPTIDTHDLLAFIYEGEVDDCIDSESDYDEEDDEDDANGANDDQEIVAPTRATTLEEEDEEVLASVKARKKKEEKRERRRKLRELLNINDGDDDDDTDSDGDQGDYPNMEFAYLDMSLHDQFYNAIYQMGTVGISQPDLQSTLGISRYIIRQLVNLYSKRKLLSTYKLDKSRQKIIMYVAKEFSNELQSRQDLLQRLNSIKCIPEPNLPAIAEPGFSDVPQINGSIKPFEIKVMLNEALTERQVERRTKIVECLNRCAIMSLTDIRFEILGRDKEESLNDEVCIRSIHRLIKSLVDAGIVNAYEITLEYGENGVRHHRYLTHPKIGINHDMMQNELRKLKNNFYLAVHEKNLRKESVEMQAQAQQGTQAMSEKTIKPIHKFNSIIMSSKSNVPKFLFARIMHEFIYHVIYDIDIDRGAYQLNDELLAEWQQYHPDLNIQEFRKECAEQTHPLPVYWKMLDWRTFVPPLQHPQQQHPSSSKPNGWAYLAELLERLPLSLFSKIFRFDTEQYADLSDYLSHPVRKHYLVKQLPLELRSRMNRIHLQKTYMLIYKMLNMMGLVQVGERVNKKDPFTMWIYLNRHTELKDTTTTEPGYSKVNPNREYATIVYEFTSAEQVTDYWRTLERICRYTKLGYRRPVSKEPEGTTVLSFTEPIDFGAAPQRDDGTVPGNRLGAAGLSSKLFAHLSRNWFWMRTIKRDPKQIRKHTILPATNSGNSVRVKLNKTVKNAWRIRLQNPLTKRTAGDSIGRKRQLGKSAPRDHIDLEALKNMRTLRVKWNSRENDVLLMGRAIYAYLSAPIATLSLLTIGRICRDIMRRLLGIKNKTCQACARRMQFLLKTNRHMPKVPNWLNLLQCNELAQQHYGDRFLQKLKQAYPNRNELTQALEVHFVLLMHLLYELIHKPDIELAPSFCIPNTTKEFYRRCIEKVTALNEDRYRHSNPRSKSNVEIAVVQNVLHSNLCCIKDKTSYNLQAFEIYKTYSEEVLTAAFHKARNDGLCVALKRRHMQSESKEISGPAYVLSSRYKARLMYLKIPYNVYNAFSSYFKGAVRTLYDTKASAASKLIELRAPHWGHMIFITEGLTRSNLQLDIKMPTHILTIDSEQSKEMCPMDRIFEYHSNILDNAPTTEYFKSLEADEGNNKQSRVKFYPAYLNYRVYYSPYDYLAKLATRQLHFFCALGSMGRRVDLNFSKLHQSDGMEYTCPFSSCIMDAENFSSAIEQIVKANRKALGNMANDTAMTAEELLSNNASTSKSNSVLVQPQNVLAIANLYENFLHDQNVAYDRKDFGKLSPYSMLASSREICWLEICDEILNFNIAIEEQEKIDELEPTLHKEERMVRAQDVFVVNLPTLTFTTSVDASSLSTTQCCDYQGQVVPQQLIETHIQRKSILEKILSETRWQYTENTWASIRPKLMEMNFTGEQLKIIEQIHDHIHENSIGVPVNELRIKFPHDQLLRNALSALSEYRLVKRVGVASYMYVHKNHIRPWVVHTFHVKRLHSESRGGYASLKRNLAESSDPETDEGEPSRKRHKSVNVSDEQELKRTPKPTRRLGDVKPATKVEMPKDIICMRPQPWIRLNGTINRRVLDRWLGSLLTECVARSGCTVADLFVRFTHMYPVDIMFLLEILGDMKCLHLTEMKAQPVTFCSNYTPIEEKTVSDLYDPDSTYVTVHGDAMSRMAVFISDKDYTADFI